MDSLEIRLIDMQIDSLQKDLTHSKELTDLKFEKTDLKFEKTEQALILQQKETERRLDGLNGEADRLQLMQRTYLNREVYEANREIVNADIKGLSRLVYIGLGIIFALQFILSFIK